MATTNETNGTIHARYRLSAMHVKNIDITNDPHQDLS